MRPVRADLESVAHAAAALRVAAMTAPRSESALDDLRELVAALDRRVPHLERDGESEIARDASALRASALKRIAELEGRPAATGGPALTGRTAAEGAIE